MTKKCSVYWIHHPDHTDMFSEGYVGFTSKEVKKRISEHVCLANKNAMRSVHLENAIRKHGIDNLILKILCVSTAEYCLELERKIRPNHGIGWNLAIGGDKPAIGRIVGDETRRKLSESSSLLVMSPEAREKIRQKAMGNKRSLGHVHSDESRKKIKAARARQVFSEETYAKIAQANTGKKRSEDFCRKISAINKGRKHSDEIKNKMSESAKIRCQKDGWNSNALAALTRIVECPHCNKVGKFSGMIRWHFDNCRHKQSIVQ